MTAGSAAIARPLTVPVPPDHSPLPFKPRRLSVGERSRRELFVFHSPRNRRTVTVADFLHLAIALKFEFDPSLVAYVERPRRMALSPRQEIDISFWTRNRDGDERYYLAIPNAGTMSSTSGTVAIRDREALDAAAARHDLRLTYLTEREMLSAIAGSATAFELLPHVWAYQRLVCRSSIRVQILAQLAATSRVTLAQLVATLDFEAANIRAVVAGMIHDGTLRLIDYTPRGTTAVIEVRHA